MDQILSQSEVEAILAALDLSTPAEHQRPNSGNHRHEPQAALYDFEHPTPLKAPELEALRQTSTAACLSMQQSLSLAMRVPVTVELLGVEQSTFRDYLVTAENPGCLASFRSAAADRECLIDLSRTLAFTFVDCVLGGQPAPIDIAGATKRSFTPVEAKVIERVLQKVLQPFVAESWLDGSTQMERLVAAPDSIAEWTSNEAVALISLDMLCGPNQGLLQFCIPWRRVSSAIKFDMRQVIASPKFIRSGAVKIPVLATARITNIKLSAQEIAGLAPGDVLLTDAAIEDGLSLEVDGQEIFRGVPGQAQARKVIRLTAPSGKSQAANAAATIPENPQFNDSNS